MTEAPSPEVDLPEDILKLIQVRLPTRAYIRSKLVSKKWDTWSIEDAHLVGRLEGASQCCYVLVEFQNARELNKIHQQACCCKNAKLDLATSSSQNRWLWSGVHNLFMKEHKLPSLEFLPGWDDQSVIYRLLACSGGLLLLHTTLPNSLRNWIPVVCNPLTKQGKVLPQFCPHLIRSFDRYPLEIYMVEGKDSSKYSVYIITFESVCIFNSDSDQWVCLEGQAHNSSDFLGVVLSSCGSVYANGRIYILDWLKRLHFVLRVYVIEEGIWLPHVTCKIEEFDHHSSTTSRAYPLYCIKPVECCGQIYAFVPVVDFVMDFVGSSVVQEGSSSSTTTSGGTDYQQRPHPVIAVSRRDFDNILAGHQRVTNMLDKMRSTQIKRCYHHTKGVNLVRLLFYLFKLDEGSSQFSTVVRIPLEIVQVIRGYEEHAITTPFVCNGRSDEICMAFGCSVVSYNLASGESLYQRRASIFKSRDASLIYKPSFVRKP